MKKQIFLFIVSVLMLVASVAAVQALDVVITPSSPDASDSLTAYVNGYEDTTFDFYWMKDGATYKTSTGTSSTLSASYTNPEDEWTVSVWVPESAWYDSYEVGDESVTIAGEAPSTSDGNVVIEPSDPCGDDDLTASVEGYEDTTFDFYWMKNGATYKTSTGTSSRLSDSYTESGDVWTVVVWVPESAWYDSFEYGSDSVEIQDCTDGGDDDTPPTYDGGNLVIEPTEPCDEDNLRAYVDGYESTTFDYYWTMGGSTYYTSTGPSSTLDDSYTEIGDLWTVTAWVPASASYDSFEYDSASVEILDCSETSDNTAPYAADIHFTVTEGDMVDVDLVQYSSVWDYLGAGIAAMVSETQDVPAYDADGDVLAIIFGLPLNLGSGQWQTEVGDAGFYQVQALVGDGTDYEEVLIEITVEEAPVIVVDTEAPVATDIHFSVTEGDLADVSVVYTNNYGTFLLAQSANSLYEETTIYVYDADSAESELTYTFSSPLNANGDWQTVLGDEGSYTADFTVTDAEGNSGSATIDITVEAEGEEPCTDSDNDGICDEDECTDANNDGICDEDECTDSDNDGICDVDECTDANNNGICDVDECTDSDNDGICDEDENASPVLDDISDVTVEEGDTVSVCASAYDAEGDVLTYGYSNIPGGSYDASTGCWIWDTTYSDAGQYTDIVVSVTDGHSTDSTSFTVKVDDICADTNANDVCDEDELSTGDYEGDLLVVQEAKVLNAHTLYSAYDVSGMDLETSGVFYIEDDTLYSTGSDDTVKVLLTLTNDNSFDTREINVHFILNGEEYTSSFEDLDRSEEGSQIYAVAIPEGLETGNYPLVVQVESDDISYETAFNLHVVSLGDYVTSAEADEEDVSQDEPLGFWDKIGAFFSSLF